MRTILLASEPDAMQDCFFFILLLFFIPLHHQAMKLGMSRSQLRQVLLKLLYRVLVLQMFQMLQDCNFYMI
jgi:hypothetical protein